MNYFAMGKFIPDNHYVKVKNKFPIQNLHKQTNVGPNFFFNRPAGLHTSKGDASQWNKCIIQ